MDYTGPDLTHTVTASDVLNMNCRSVPGMVRKATEASESSDLIAAALKVKGNRRSSSASIPIAVLSAHSSPCAILRGAEMTEAVSHVSSSAVQTTKGARWTKHAQTDGGAKDC